MNYILLSLALLSVTLSVRGESPPSENPLSESTSPTSPTAPVENLAYRLIGERSRDFVFKLDPSLASEKERIVRIQRLPNKKIQISGATPISLTSGLNLYLKRYVHSHISWAHDSVAFPNVLPGSKEGTEYRTKQVHGTAFNYCTFSYTMAWWDEKRWEREIDLLALYGIDTPLAVLGMEEVWAKVLERFHYSRKEALAFPSSPAFTAWWLMGNIEGTGGPVSEDYVQSRVKLQQKILKRMRELGMRPVLQGFVGIVPLNFAEKNPGARLLDQGKWCGVPRSPVLHPDDPLFPQIARAWYEELEKLYGKADVFAGDLFHEGGNSHDIDVPAMAQKVQSFMREHNPNAIWSLQGWSGNPSQNLLKGLDPKHTEVVELCNEFFRNWERTKGFYGKPWYFSSIVQYGGNTGLHGRLPALWKNFRDAGKSAYPPVGIGLTWESTGINPIAADLVTDIHWTPGEPTMKEWIDAYAYRRYGHRFSLIEDAWHCLIDSAYGEYPNHRRPTESIFCAVPGINVKKASPFAASVELPYNLRILRDGLKNLLEAEFAGKDSVIGRDPKTYNHDIVDISRQFLSGLGLIAYKEMMEADKKKDLAAFQEASDMFQHLLVTQDTLLGADEDFLLGTVLASARKSAPKGEEDQFEFHARCLMTTWFPNSEPGTLSNYGWQERSGLLIDYYLPRWEAFIKHRKEVISGKESKAPQYRENEIAWTKELKKYRSQPQGTPVTLAKEILKTGSEWLEKKGRYSYTPPQTGKQESSKDAR